ncbi:MAG: prenyltransferase/squalene oxidase repeat-containing protein [Planctomycetota bacterium]|jgi:hypothetical protein
MDPDGSRRVAHATSHHHDAAEAPTGSRVAADGGEEPPGRPLRLRRVPLAALLALLALPALVQGGGLPRDLSLVDQSADDPSTPTPDSRRQGAPAASAGEVVAGEGELTYPGRRQDASRAHLERFEEVTDRAIERGLRYLCDRQADSGHISAQYSVAVTALGGMAMLGNGAAYGRGPWGFNLREAVRYLTSPAVVQPNGFISEGDSTNTPSRMHGHTYAILFLSQVVGTLPDPRRDAELRSVVARGVRLILESQTARGGWGYLPEDESDEASLTVCALQALRAAKDAGFTVPPDAIRSAVRYLKDCCKKDGSFRYSLALNSQESTYELTAAAVSTLDAAGEYGMAEHDRGVEFLRATVDGVIARRGRVLDAASGYPYYGNLYAGQVFFQLGGDIWRAWSAEVWPELCRRQKGDGHWESRFGNEYATAVALLILEIPRGYLPIFER